MSDIVWREVDEAMWFRSPGADGWVAVGKACSMSYAVTVCINELGDHGVAVEWSDDRDEDGTTWHVFAAQGPFADLYAAQRWGLARAESQALRYSEQGK